MDLVIHYSPLAESLTHLTCDSMFDLLRTLAEKWEDTLISCVYSEGPGGGHPHFHALLTGPRLPRSDSCRRSLYTKSKVSSKEYPNMIRVEALRSMVAMRSYLRKNLSEVGGRWMRNDHHITERDRVGIKKITYAEFLERAYSWASEAKMVHQMHHEDEPFVFEPIEFHEFVKSIVKERYDLVAIPPKKLQGIYIQLRVLYSDKHPDVDFLNPKVWSKMM